MRPISHRNRRALLTSALLVSTTTARAEPEPGTIDMTWDEGADDCAASRSPPIQVHAYNATTFILRESLCRTSEAPFLYLLVGRTRALLVDTGDVADAASMPLASTVLGLLPGEGDAKPPLLVAHTHGHLDHRSGDAQFRGVPRAEVVATDLAHVRQFFRFDDWPNGVATLDLGGRVVDVLPTPGHYPSEVSYYDRATGLLLTGDMLLPGRLSVDDQGADVASAERLVAFCEGHPVTYVLGAHVEVDTSGATYAPGASHHPHEHALPLTPDDLFALPATLRGFNGWYGRRGMFILYNQTRLLLVLAVAFLFVVAATVALARRYLRRRRERRAAGA